MSSHDNKKLSIRKYSAVLALMLVLVMSVLNVTLVNVALPTLTHDFNVSDSTVVWIVTSYQLVITALLLPLSSIGDLYSYKKTYLVGVSLFTVSSAACGIATSFGMLVALRALQGIGAACIMSVTVALMRLIYPPNILGRGLALNAMAIAISTAAGPALAGFIISSFSWRWLFFINLPFGITAFAIGLRLLPENPISDNRREKFDFVSAIANVLAFSLIFYSLGNISHKGNISVDFVMLATGTTIGYFYLRHQRGKMFPMLPIDLFSSKVYSLSILTSTSSFISQSLAMIALPFIFINTCGLSEIATGLLMTPWPVATLILSPMVARYVEHHNPGRTASMGMIVYASGLMALILMPGEGVSEWDIAWRMAVCGIGYALFQTPNNIVMLNATPLNRSGGAGGMQSTARLTGQTLGAILATVLFSISAKYGFSANISLIVAMFFAILAGIFSITRSR